MCNYKNILKVLFVVLGTIIGAGFASGKEIYNFFAVYGYMGILGINIAGILAGIIIYSTLNVCEKRKIKNNKELMENINEPQFLYNIVNIFLLISFYIMIAGFSSFFKQEYDISTYITSSLLAIFMYFILSHKMSGIIKINVLLVPLLIVAMLFISLKYGNLQALGTESTKVLPCTISAILYASYNGITLIPILITLNDLVQRKKEKVIVSILSAIFIIILAFGIFGMLINSNMNIKNVELPTIMILNNKIEKITYSIAIEVAILTSAVAAGYGVLENVKEKTIVDNKKYKRIVAIMCIISIPISTIGFGNLIKTLYPLFGALGILQIVLILKNSVAKV